MRQIAKFRGGTFANVDEGLWRDDSGNYFVGGEMPLPAERVQEMESANELEWLPSEGLISAAATEEMAGKTTSKPVEPTSKELEGEQVPSKELSDVTADKKSPLPWVAAIVGIVVIGIVAVVFILNQPEPVEQVAEVPSVEHPAEPELTPELELEAEEQDEPALAPPAGNIVTFDEEWAGVTFDYNADLLEVSMFEPEILASIDGGTTTVEVWTDYSPGASTKEELFDDIVTWIIADNNTLEISKIGQESMEIAWLNSDGNIIHTVYWGFNYEAPFGLWYSSLTITYPAAEQDFWSTEVQRIFSSLKW